ncbi:integrase catalytic domain-containing protein [Trichonephila clavipes]|nr:integrase catalytic domain-containing protein [Trichonephila clavipes]
MFDPSSFANPTPLAHADTSRDVLPRGGTSYSSFQEEIEFLAKGGCNSKKASKAVHLEIVSDLTTDAFLATLKRFVARRGKCATISSDNAKNFVGSNRELKRLHNLLKFPEEKLSSYLSFEGISWNFMPPRAPNFGGLWEAGVK